MSETTRHPLRRILVLETAAPVGGILYAQRRDEACESADTDAGDGGEGRAEGEGAMPPTPQNSGVLGGFEIREHSFSAPHQHAQMLIPMLAELLPVAPQELDLLLVDRGPGSHTGTRIGLAVAKMIAWQVGTPALGLNALDALAWESIASGHVATNELVALLPCRKGLVYARRYSRAPHRPLTEPALVELGEALPAEWQGCTVFGEAVSREPRLQAAVQTGEVLTHGALPSWPTPRPLLQHALATLSERGMPSEAEASASLTPLYLSPITAKTLAERRAAGIVR